MINRRIQRLPGMRDSTANGYERIRGAVETLTAYLREKGYAAIDTPLLEETELFVRKGGEFTSRLYTFTDPGGHNVSLRPEFTSSAIRHFIQERESLTLPVRWQYNGPVFRFEPGENGSYRQFTQVGAELVGAVGIEADVEIIRLALEGLGKIGVQGSQIRIGHLRVLHELLNSFGLSEPAKLFIMGNVQALKSGSIDAAALKERAVEVGLVGPVLELDTGTDAAEMSEEEAQGYIESVLKDSLPTSLGRRTTQQIAARLLRKVRDADDPSTFEQATATISRLAQLEGAYEAVLKEAKQIVSERGLKSSPLEELGGLFDDLVERKAQEAELVLDLGLARGFAYYTGVIFEMANSFPTPGVSLGGGGRYDGLVKALGGEEDVPALGFAFNLEPLINTLSGGVPARSQALRSP